MHNNRTTPNFGAIGNQWWNPSRRFDQISFYFRRHLLGIELKSPGDGVRSPYIASGFLLDYYGWKLWVTAGHIVREIEHARANLPPELLVGHWLDLWPGRYGQMPPACMHERASAWVDENGVDIGIMQLSDNEADLITAKNTSEFLTPNSWNRNPSAPPEGFFLAGYPRQGFTISSITHSGERDEYDVKQSFLAGCFEVVETDPAMEKHTDEFWNVPGSFYGNLVGFANQKQITDIIGTSGGPIFSINQEDGGFRYHLVAIQGSWLKLETAIRGTRIEILDHLLRRALRDVSSSN